MRSASTELVFNIILPVTSSKRGFCYSVYNGFVFSILPAVVAMERDGQTELAAWGIVD